MSESAGDKPTCLHDLHVALGARMAPFGGFLMPIQYEGGIVAEHHATRQNATLFDTCHMGEFRLFGPSAGADIDRLVSCHVLNLAEGQCRYGLMCNEAGGVIDDLLVYRMGPDEWMLVVNAGTQDNDFEWVKDHLSYGTKIENLSAGMAKIDVQGPKSAEILATLAEEPIGGLGYYRFDWNRYKGRQVLVSRTGYTGELGFEFYSDEESAVEFWQACMDLGAEPAGLGARDTLRLEMGMPLYGHELDASRNAAESGFSRSIARDKSFVGSTVVLDDSKKKYQLVGIVFEGRRAARNGDGIVDAAGSRVGVITSGSFAPSLDKAVALGYVERSLTAAGTALTVQTARQPLPGVVADLPFYKKGTARQKIG